MVTMVSYVATGYGIILFLVWVFLWGGDKYSSVYIVGKDSINVVYYTLHTIPFRDRGPLHVHLKSNALPTALMRVDITKVIILDKVNLSKILILSIKTKFAKSDILT